MGGIVSKKSSGKSSSNHHRSQAPNAGCEPVSEATLGAPLARRPPIHPRSSSSSAIQSSAMQPHREMLRLELAPSTPATSNRDIDRHRLYYNFVCDTPSDRSSFKYYCPLCMRHFEDILYVPCCRNYLCLECCIGFLASKGMEASGLQEILASSQHLSLLACPHCSSDGFRPERVHQNDPVRDYHWTPRAAVVNFDASPLRVGDSFEDMKR